MERRLVFIGSDRIGTNDRSLRDGFIAEGCACWSLDGSHLVSPRRWSREHLSMRVRGHPGSAALTSFQDAACRLVSDVRPEAVIIFKGTWLDAPTADVIAGIAPIVDVHPDDIANPENVSSGYIESLPYVSLSITHRRENVDDLKGLGVRNVLLLPQAFDPNIHTFAGQPSPAEWDVSFVGSSRPERAAAITALARSTPLRLRIAGHGWSRGSLPRAVVTPPVWGLEMARVVSASTMSLVFVNHQNRDQRTYRSFEVPAIGSMFLGERTGEHEATFVDGVEAVFFSSIIEMIEKASRYAEDAEEAAAIARRGHEAVWRLGARYRDRAREILAALDVTQGTHA